MPNVSAGSKRKSDQRTKAPRKATAAKKAAPAKKSGTGTPVVNPYAKRLAAKVAALPLIEKKAIYRSGQLRKTETGPRISFEAYVESEIQTMPGVKPAPRRKLATGAREFTNILAAYLSPADAPGKLSERPPAFEQKVAGFARAVEKIVQAVPAGNRRVLIQDLRRALDEAANAEPSDALAEQPLTSVTAIATVDFMADMRRQEAAQWQKDMSEGRLLPGAEMSKRLGVRPQSLSAALKKKRIFAITGPSGEYYYPAFFAEDKKYDRPVLEKICMALGDLPSGSKWDFFTAKRISLDGRSPLEALAKGKVEAVMNAAKAFAEE